MQQRLKVLTAYDIAASQYLELFDYATERSPLAGRVRRPITSRVGPAGRV